MSDRSPPQQLRKRHKSGPPSSGTTSPSLSSPSGSEPSTSGIPHTPIQSPTLPHQPSPHSSTPHSPTPPYVSSDSMSTSSGGGQELPQDIQDYYTDHMPDLQGLEQLDILMAYFNDPSYVFLQHLGSGAFGEVFKACHPEHLDLEVEENLERPEFAIKIFRESDPDDNIQFQLESTYK